MKSPQKYPLKPHCGKGKKTRGEIAAKSRQKYPKKLHRGKGVVSPAIRRRKHGEKIFRRRFPLNFPLGKYVHFPTNLSWKWSISTRKGYFYWGFSFPRLDCTFKVRPYFIPSCLFTYIVMNLYYLRRYKIQLCLFFTIRRSFNFRRSNLDH